MVAGAWTREALQQKVGKRATSLLEGRAHPVQEVVPILPAPPDSPIQIRHVRLAGATVVLAAAGIAEAGCCPTCGTANDRIHNRSQRWLLDRPGRGHVVRLPLTVRRLRCLNPQCVHAPCRGLRLPPAAARLAPDRRRPPAAGTGATGGRRRRCASGPRQRTAQQSRYPAAPYPAPAGGTVSSPSRARGGRRLPAAGAPRRHPPGRSGDAAAH